VLEHPLTGDQAFEIIDYYRNRTGWLKCDYKIAFWNDMVPYLKMDELHSANIFDLRLAVTLKNNNVQKLYTRNIKDFADYPWFEVIDPIG
jgi:hypothetical protein